MSRNTSYSPAKFLSIFFPRKFWFRMRARTSAHPHPSFMWLFATLGSFVYDGLERGKAVDRDSLRKKTSRKSHSSAQKCALKIWHWHGGETFDSLDCLFTELRFILSLGVGESTVSGCSKHLKEVKGLAKCSFGRQSTNNLFKRR